MTPLAAKVLELAAAEVGVREESRNRGKAIDAYNRDIGHDPEKRDPWCAIFVSAMVKRACDALGVPVPIHLTAGVFTLDEQAPRQMRRSVPTSGSIFILGGHKHTGLVETVFPNGNCITVEGNTNDGGSPEGDGVYRRTRERRELLCFVDLNEAPF